jgi:preprotein translocase SecE subunit
LTYDYSRFFKLKDKILARTKKIAKIKSKKRINKFKAPVFTKVFISKIGKVILKLLRPFRFLLAPFRLKFVKKIGNILAKVFLINYFVSSWRELKQVVWPSRRETIQLTLAVFAFAIGFGVLIAILDYVINLLVKEVIL